MLSECTPQLKVCALSTHPAGALEVAILPFTHSRWQPFAVLDYPIEHSLWTDSTKKTGEDAETQYNLNSPSGNSCAGLALKASATLIPIAALLCEVSVLCLLYHCGRPVPNPTCGVRARCPERLSDLRFWLGIINMYVSTGHCETGITITSQRIVRPLVAGSPIAITAF